MRRFLIGLLATIGGLVVLLALAGGIAGWLFWPPGPPPLPERIVLTLDLRDGVDEVPATDPLSAFALPAPTLHDVILTLEQAAHDERVGGLLVRLDGEGLGFAQIQEIRAAVQAFRATGRVALAHADSLGEFGPGTGGYYLASAFDEIHLQPLGAVGLTGLLLETPLFRGVLDQLGIQPDGGRRGEYKSIYEQFTARTFTPELRQSMEGLATSLYDQLVEDLAAARDLAPAEVRRLIDGGPYVAEEALEAGLVDALSYHDEALDAVLERAGPASQQVPLERYFAALPDVTDAPVVALIDAVGQIARGESQRGPVQSVVMGADTVAEAIGDAVADPEVRAILVRIDSGGGSAVASETIGRAVRQAVAKGKPVIASLGDVAASGGYWIAMDASRVIARPGTLTGSIGVVIGKPVLSGLFDEVGLRFGRVSRGQNAEMWSLDVPFSGAAEARLEAFLDHTYTAFTDGVARGRDLDPAAVTAAAEGRVWTGAQALDLGLVDDLGGHAQAIAVAREEAGAGPGQPVAFRPYPRPRTPLEQALELLNGSFAGLGRLTAWLQALQPDGALSAPPLEIR